MKYKIITALVIIVVLLAALYVVGISIKNKTINEANHDAGTGMNDEENGGNIGKPSPKLPPGSSPVADPALIKGSVWVWDKTVFANGTVVTPMKSGAFSINLTQDGRVNGTTDCNGFGGEYQVGSDGIITFGEFMSTQMYCEGSQEGEFNSMITKVKSYSLDLEGNLVMILNNNEGSIFFKKKVGIIN